MNQIKIGQFISEMRKEKGLTQEQLADRLLISGKTVSKWECGKGLPEVSSMLPLCEALEINVNELLTGERILDESYKEKAEKNMMMLIEEEEKSQRKSILNLLENSDVYNRVKKCGNVSAKELQTVINDICEIAVCAVNNGLLELKKFLEYPNIDPFMKELIYFSTNSEKLLSCDELFEAFSVRIRVTDQTDEDLIRHLIMLQGYMYILHGKNVNKIHDMLLICFGELLS